MRQNDRALSDCNRCAADSGPKGAEAAETDHRRAREGGEIAEVSIDAGGGAAVYGRPPIERNRKSQARLNSRGFVISGCSRSGSREARATSVAPRALLL